MIKHEDIPKIRLESFLIAEKEVEAGRNCTIMGRTFKKEDLGYIKKRIKEIKEGGR